MGEEQRDLGAIVQKKALIFVLLSLTLNTCSIAAPLRSSESRTFHVASLLVSCNLGRYGDYIVQRLVPMTPSAIRPYCEDNTGE